MRIASIRNMHNLLNKQNARKSFKIMRLDSTAAFESLSIFRLQIVWEVNECVRKIFVFGLGLTQV